MTGAIRPRSVAWLSPYSLASDVSRFTHCLLPHMRPESDPDWSFTLMVNDNGRRFESILPAAGIASPSDTAQLLATVDFPIYNVGNNSENHGQITKVLRERPGVIVLHDMVYQHLLAWECMEARHSPQLYARIMGDVHGAEGLDAVIKSGLVAAAGPRRYSIWDTPLAESFPLAKMLAGLASGVIVHSDYAERKVREVFDGPVLRLALPWDQKPWLSDEEIASWANTARAGKRSVFVAFGHISRSKNLDRLIRAFSVRPELTDMARLVIAGYPGERGYVAELEQLVAEHNLSEVVSLEYAVTDRRLRQLKLEADAFVNIRMPVTESASGSLTEQLNAAKPVVVYARGCYEELPDDGTIKLDPDSGDFGVADAMVALAKDPEARIRIGAAGRDYVRRVGSADYVSRLKAFLTAEEETLKRRQRLAVPISAANPWSMSDVADEDRTWFTGLTRTRAAWNALDLDPHCWSPAPFLEWPAEQAARFGTGVVLGVEITPELQGAALRIIADHGAWDYYKTINILRRKLWLARQDMVPERLGANERQFISDIDYWRLAIHLEPHIVARLCFLSLLGRGWELGEDLAWADLFASGGNPREVLARILDDEEVRLAKAHTSEIEKLRAWCQAPEEDAPQRRETGTSAIFTWPVSARVKFGGARAEALAMMHGPWYDAEAEGRWIRGRTALLRFLPQHKGDDDLVLDLSFRVAGSQATGPRTVSVTSSLGYSQTKRVDNDAIQHFHVSLPLHPDEAAAPITLRIEVSQSVSLAALGLSADSRDLGLMLLSGELRRAGGAAVDPPAIFIGRAAPTHLSLAASEEPHEGPHAPVEQHEPKSRSAARGKRA